MPPTLLYDSGFKWIKIQRLKKWFEFYQIQPREKNKNMKFRGQGHGTKKYSYKNKNFEKSGKSTLLVFVWARVSLRITVDIE